MKKLIIYGTGYIAEVADFYFTRETDYEVCAFTNAKEFIESPDFLGRPLVNFDDVETLYPPPEFAIYIAIGYAKTNQIRYLRYCEAKQKGYQCASYISPSACNYSLEIGENCFILEDNVIQPFVSIGNNVTLWSGNHIGHHSVIKDNVFISSHVVVSGNCVVDEYCFLGVNATLRDGINLGKSVVVGAGALVMKDCDERTLVQAPVSSYKAIKRDVI